MKGDNTIDGFIIALMYASMVYRGEVVVVETSQAKADEVYEAAKRFVERRTKGG